MALALAATAILLMAATAELAGPRFQRAWRRRQAQRGTPAPMLADPGRERRAEQKARALLRSCVNQEDWEMYSELGFIRLGAAAPETDIAYLLYPHRPIVAYEPSTGRILGEYCVTFEDPSPAYGSSRLPDSDDVLAKWMALTADERRLISRANLHLPGRQVDLESVERDLQRLKRWDGGRASTRAAAAS